MGCKQRLRHAGAAGGLVAFFLPRLPPLFPEEALARGHNPAATCCSRVVGRSAHAPSASWLGRAGSADYMAVTSGTAGCRRFESAASRLPPCPGQTLLALSLLRCCGAVVVLRRRFRVVYGCCGPGLPLSVLALSRVLAGSAAAVAAVQGPKHEWRHDRRCSQRRSRRGSTHRRWGIPKPRNITSATTTTEEQGTDNNTSQPQMSAAATTSKGRDNGTSTAADITGVPAATFSQHMSRVAVNGGTSRARQLSSLVFLQQWTGGRKSRRELWAASRRETSSTPP